MMTTSREQMAELLKTNQLAAVSPRRLYHPPLLQEYGNLRGLTLGGSIGASDSGNNNMQVFPFAPEGYEDLP